MLISYVVISNAPESSISLNIFLFSEKFISLVACYFRFLIMLHNFVLYNFYSLVSCL